MKRHVAKARCVDLVANNVLVAIAVGRSSQESRWVAWKKLSESFRNHVRKLIIRDSIPHAEDEMPTWLQNAMCFTICSFLVRKEHDPKLAHDNIKPLIIERQMKRVGLPPLDAPILVRSNY